MTDLPTDRPLLSAAESHQIRLGWNDTRVERRPGLTLPTLFAERVAQAPEAPALTFEGRTLSYRELDQISGRLAFRLLGLGIRPDTAVGVLMERSVEMVVALLGVLRAGAAYLPLDPESPAERLGWILADARVPVLLAQERLLPALPPTEAHVLRLEAGWEGEGEPEVRIDPPDQGLAYVLYTSGSTGRPKGVMIPHRGIVNRLLWMQEAYGLTAQDRVLQKTTYSFDVSVWEFFWPLITGAHLVVARPGGHRDSAYLAALIGRARVTVMHFVPSMLQLFLEEPDLSSCAGLRLVVASGEALTPELRRRCRERLAARLENLYGPTEAAVDVTSWNCAAEARGGIVPIGRPVANTRIYLLDRLLRPVPAGIPGELCIGGVQLARGYFKRPHLTAERFVPDPCGETPGDRLYRTGDLARHLPDGALEYLGRLDFQVKVRGFRIELGEIESALAAVPGVREAVVVARADRSDRSGGSVGSPGDRRLIAYVTGDAAVEELRRSLRERLPDYMIPAAFVSLATLPLTPSGKVDRGALPDPAPLASGEAYAAPRTATEELLAAAWAEALGLARAGIHDDLFALGGHSLTAARVLARLRAARGVELPLRILFEAPTPAALAAHVDGLPANPPQAAPPLAPAPRQGPLPLSFAQERLWFLDRLAPGSAAYNLPLGLRLTGSLDATALRRSLGEIARRHETLRTAFPATPEGRPRQAAAPARGLPLPRVDLTALPAAAREAEARRLAGDEARRPFALALGPPFRALLVRLAAADWLAVLNLHHIVSDAWSQDLLLRELEALYRAFRRGLPSPLAEPPLQYADFARWQRQRLRGEVLDAHAAYWRDALAGAPAELELPADRPRPAAPSFRGSQVRGALAAGPPALLARRSGATPFMVLLAGLQAFLYRVTGQTDLSVGSPVADRERPEVEGLIGLFVNTVVLRGAVAGADPFGDLLGRARETVLAALAHQDLPFERVVDALGAERRGGRNPLFQVILADQGTRPKPPALPELAVEVVDLFPGAVPFDLGLAVEAAGERLEMVLEYASELFDRTTALRLLGQLRALLAGAAADPGLAVRDLPLLSAAERHQALSEWNDAAAADPRPAPAPRLFAEQARRTPDAVAVVHGGHRLTYAEIDRRARGLARRLRTLGVRRETRVGLLAGRSPAMVAALMGIWKAGGAFVPLDPGQPDARLAGLLADALSGQAAPVLVTERALAERAAGMSPSVVVCDEEGGHEDDGEPLPEARPGDLAYLIFTSGTTGRPKAVQVEHGSLAATLAACREAFGFAATDRMPCLAPFTFDIFLFELLGPLLAGGTSVLFDLRPILDVPALAAALGEMTLLHAVPALMRQVVAEARPLPAAARRSLRRIFVGGDAVPSDLLAGLREVFPAAPATVLYGPTESAILATRCEIDEPPAGDRRPLGRPLAGAVIVLRDRDGNPVPPGTAGEVWIGGPGVARGYLHQEELTADRFVEREGRRWYRTGDRARRRPDGGLDFLGRADDQVKVRGFRIEPGEVEAALRGHPAVREAVVAARDDATGERELAAWVVLVDGREVPPAALAAFLRDRLPEPLVPTAWSVLPRLPLTVHGKVDRQALPDPERGEGGPEAAPPRTPTEELLAGIWTALLQRDRVGADDDFFACGGHSLLALQAVSRIRDAFGVEIPVGVLFEAPTPAALARRLEEARGGPEPPPPIVPAGREGSPPLSFAQERLWFLHQLQPGSLYNVPLVLRLRGRLDATAWAAAWEEVRRRHQTLRTTFPGRGAPVQVIEPFVARPLPVADLAALPGPAREQEARRLAAAAAARPFDLAREAPCRTSLVRLAGNEHLVLAVFHHIASDAWSTGVLLAEIRELYAAFSAGRPSPLRELTVQYADYAVWERRRLDGPALAAGLAWWRRRLADLPALELPADRSRPASPSFHGRLLPEALPAELSRALASRVRERGATLFMGLLASFATLLHRVTGNLDLAVGMPVANRERPEVEGLIGFFVNTLVARIDLAGDPPFSALLGRVRDTALAAYAHREVPFDRLVEELGPERTLDENPLFQVAFSLDRPAATDFTALGLDVAPAAVHSGTAKFDLYLGLEETSAGIAGSWEYKTDLFDAPTLVRLGGHWRNLVTDLAAHPDRRLGELGLLSPAERHQLAREWTDTATDYPREATLPELFARQVERAPDAVALVQGDAVLTYRGLDARAGRVAARLRRLGVGPDVPVALALPRSCDLVAAILGILQAGGAYLPLDPSHPRERLARLLRGSGAAAVVTRGELLDRLPAAGIPVLDLDGLAAEPVTAPSPPLHPESLAYVMYTSGSTGVPKGVAVTHRNVARLVLETDYARFGPDEVFLQFAPVAFDASTLEIWGPLLHGGRLVLAPEGRVSLAELGATVRRAGVSTLWLTAGLFHQMVDEEIGGLAGVRQLLAGGDVLSPDRVRRALERLPDAVVIDGYGPTEGTTFSCCHRMTAPGEVGPSVPIGRPIANTRAWVLDSGMRPQAIGPHGDLYLGGDGLARGYFGRPDLTAERFVPDPFSHGGRLYRTGDRARWLPGGRLDFLGRSDLQVKVAGWRIEPGEIETALLGHPAVREAAVAARDDGGSGKRLVAWVTAEPPAPAADELRAWLRERLPESMIPSLWVCLDRLPLTANGKVDRAALPEPAPDPGLPGDSPPDPAQELLAGLWAELLGLPAVGVHDDFFGLGGHSLLATRLVARVRALFGVDLPLRALFAEPTVAGLAARIAEGLAGAPFPPIEPLPLAEVGPASLAQRRLWFLQRLSPGEFFLNVSQGLELLGRLTVPALRRVLEAIVARHEPLRTTFETRDGQPVQRLAPARPCPLPVADLSALPPQRRDVEARRLAVAEAERPFDLARGPLLRTVLLRLGPARHHLLLTLHHLVFDGWSMGVLFRELSTLYGAFSQGLSSPLPPLPVRFAEFGEWQRRMLAGPRLEGQLAWWRERLAGLPNLELPTDRPRPPVPRFGGGWKTAALPGIAGRIEVLGRRCGVTPFMVLLAGFEVVLARVSGQTDFPLGSPVANRSRPEIEDLIGFFANTLVLRADLAGNPQFRELLARVRETSLAAWAHQDLPFEVLVEELAPERHLSLNPLFQAVLSLQDLPAGFRLPGLAARPFDFDSDVAQFDLTLVANRSPDGLALTLNYRRDLFDPATVLRLLEQLGTLLAGAAADPEAPVGDLPFWSEAARHQALREWSVAAPAAPGGLTVDRLIEEQARRAPEALAVAGPGTRLTYGELDRWANRLARRLRGLGVGRGARIALALDRSPELVVAALAVWKAGGAYLPLDPLAPAERSAGVVDDAGVPWVLTLERWAGRFAGGRAGVLRLDAEGESGCGESDRPPQRATGPADPAYVIYTSGSTGRPKGVEVPHAGLLGLIAWHLRAYTVSPEDRATLVANPAFDAAVWETWPYLVAGASLHVPPREVAASPGALLEWLAAEGVTLAFLPTPLAEEALGRQIPRNLALRALLTGGDRLRRSPAAGPGFRLVNHYGPTESSVVATCGPVEAGEARPPAIGRPIDGVETLLLGPDRNPVPPGALGEICVGGGGLATGYPGHPELTAERFIPHPFAAEPGARLYRTGDLGRFRADGRIEFGGRADDQVKIRGFRIEPGEVEARLATHPAVAEAVVLAREDAPGSPRLAAYVVPRPGCTAEAAALRDFLRALLPEPMVPSAWVTLESLPVTSRGKVDRAALPPPAPPAAAPREAPSGGTEESLERLWREVLGIRAAGRDDNFFDLGGHSLALAAVHERLQAELEIQLPLVDLFENPTIRTLAASLEGRRAPRGEPAGRPAEALGRAERQRNAAAWKERTRQARRLNQPA